MSTHVKHQDRGTRPRTRAAGKASRRETIARIAVGVDGYPEGRDAAALAAAIAGVTGAEVLLVAVHPDPLVVLPEGMNWTSLREDAVRTLREVRDSHAPGARIVAETDVSVARALHRVIRREHRDLLIVGSSRHAPEGRVRIGKRTRQLLCNFEGALAIAPRGLHAHPPVPLGRIGVGYDGGAESEAALALAASIATDAGAELHVRSVVDDRIPPIGFSALAPGGAALPIWEEAVMAEISSLDELQASAMKALYTNARREVVRGRPADALLALAAEVDLLVIGSRRWGSVERLLLGSTGEALLHDAPCPVLAVPGRHAKPRRRRG
jgi:nucleotide-binding universal stress UspA family protein